MINFDPHTQSNYNEVKIQHLHLDIDVNFEKRTISGSAAFTIQNLKKSDILIREASSKLLNLYYSDTI